MRTPGTASPRILALVLLGGTVGGAVRIFIEWLAPGAAADTAAFIAINVVGAAALGFVVGYGQATKLGWWFPAVGPGLLGGFTSFSAMAALSWTAALLPAFAAVFLALNLILSVGAAAGGFALGHRQGLAKVQRVPS